MVDSPSASSAAIIEATADSQTVANSAFPDKKDWNGFFIGLVGTLLLAGTAYCALAFCWPKFSRAEVFFAECAREMLIAHNFVTPLYHKQAFFDKPILVYWLIIAMFELFGLSHFAARIPSIVAALGTIALTGLAGRALFGQKAGFIAASMLATSFMFVSFASLAMSDMLLVLFDTLTLSLIYLGIQIDQKRQLLWMLAAISMGCAFLIKGPIGLVLPAVASFVFLALTRKLNIIRLQHIILGTLIVVLVASPWFIAAYRANGVSALIYFFMHENLQRFASSTYDAGKPFWYMITSFFYGFAPWSILLPFAAIELARVIPSKRSAGACAVSREYTPAESQVSVVQVLAPSGSEYAPVESKFQRGVLHAPIPSENPQYRTNTAPLFLWLWLLIAVGFFCFSRGKCDYYALPAYPAAAILAAQYLSTQIDRHTLFARYIFGLFGIASLICAVCSAIILRTLVMDNGGSTQWLAIPLILMTAFVSICVLSKQRRLFACYTACAVAIPLVIMAVSVQILPIISSLVPIDKYAHVIKTVPENTKIVVDQSLHSWIDEISFQTGTHPIVLTDPPSFRQFLCSTDPCIILTPENKLSTLPPDCLARLHILKKDMVVTHALTPGYVLERRGKLVDAAPVVMAANFEIQPARSFVFPVGARGGSEISSCQSVYEDAESRTRRSSVRSTRPPVSVVQALAPSDQATADRSIVQGASFSCPGSKFRRGQLQAQSQSEITK